MNESRNIAARLGGWSARHRRKAIFGWLLFVILATVIGGAIGQRDAHDYELGSGDSARAQQMLYDAGIKTPAGEMLLVHSANPNGWHSAATALSTAITHTGQVDDVKAPIVSADRRDALIRFDIVGEESTADKRLPPVTAAVSSVRSAYPGTQIDEFGDATVNKWVNDTLGVDFKHAEWTAVPIALGILLVAFGALLAAFIPVLLALSAFLAANGLLAFASRGLHVFDTTSSVMLLVGLAVGVDYCLFYLRRERDERAAGHDPEASLRIAAATAGRSVLVAGVTVIVAMCGMYFSGLLLLKGFALAVTLVVAVAMLGSVTVLPAILSLLGDRVEAGRIPLLGRQRSAPKRPKRRQRRAAVPYPVGTDWDVMPTVDVQRHAAKPRREAGRITGALMRPVLARPKTFATLSIGVLVLLAAPALGMHTEKLTSQQFPASSPITVAYQKVQAAFPGGPSPAQVVVKAANLEAPRVQQALATFESSVARSGEFGTPVVVVHAPQNIVEISVPMPGDGSDQTSVNALNLLRDKLAPAAFTGVATAYVGGDLASSIDFNTQLHHGVVPMVLFVVGVTLVLMLLAFRSPAIAVMSVLLNLLSVAAAFGILTAVFQHGWGASLVGSYGVGAIESWLPSFIFVVLFGLSMDYHVLVVSRIREARLEGRSARDAIAHGVRSTAGVVTSAAVIMVAVFAVFATLNMLDFKQLGVGLAAAVLLDATLVRTILLPSVMAILGERVWRRSSRVELPERVEVGVG